MRPLQARERKLLAIGLLILLVALLWTLLVAPFLDGFSTRGEERDVLRAAYARNTRLINAIPQLRRRADRQHDQIAAFAMGGANIGVARDALRERLRRDVTSVGGQVTAMQDMPAAPGDVRAWVQARVTLAQLEALLIRVNDTPRYLVTESLRVSADRAMESGHLDILDVRLEVSIPYIPSAS